MADALIGHTGFVGSNLARQMRFDAFFNSKNIDTIWGREFGTIVCAGAYGRKWWANENPREDWASIRRLVDAVRSTRRDRLILISTVDVYSDPRHVDEETRTTTEGLCWYGVGRLLLEELIYPTHIIRLPALFGPSLKKNALFDLMHGKAGEIPENATYQWYPVSVLANRLAKAVADDIRLLNLTSEPLALCEVRDRFYPHERLGPHRADAPYYDVRSIHDGFRLTSGEVFQEMETYLAGNEGSL